MMDDNLMSLGLFVFRLNTAPFEKTSRNTRIDLPGRKAIGVGPAYQYNGLEEDTLTISGVLMPPVTGDGTTLDTLRTMQLQGRSWNLVSGRGEDMGAWFIKDVSETGSFHTGDGRPRRIEFDLALVLAPDLTALGALADSR